VDFEFSGLNCLVSGGGRGIGKAVALGLAGAGARVGVLARTEKQCEEVASSIAGVAIVCDVTSSESCVSAVERFGPVDVLVNAAGISPVWRRAEELDLAAWSSIIETNLTGAYLLSRAAGPSLRARRGAVVNVASVEGVRGSPRLAAYGASKAGLIHLTRTLAREWASEGVRVNAVLPGYVNTDLTAAFLGVPRLRDEVVAATPLGRLATVAEVAAPILFLASAQASFVTGAALPVDGGMLA
jgi:NAD(P)-dependent dehydrogenase (short-subunit alcohol dehydrogenase family)